MPTVDLTARLARESAPGAKDVILFDRAAPGFGLRIHPSGRKVYIVQTRIAGKSRRMVIARHGEMDIDEARRRARVILARVQAGEDPAGEARRAKHTPTVKAFAEEYLRRCDPRWKPSGRKTVRIYLKARILPAFGRMRIDEIGPVEVAAWFDAASRDRPGAANRALEILRAMMFKAEEWGWRERDANPCLGIRKNPRCKVARAVPRCRRARTVGPRPRRPRGRMARCGRRDPPAGAHRLPARRSARSSMARHRTGGDPPSRQQDRTARRTSRRRHGTTAGYAHLADGHLVEAAEKVGKVIAVAMANNLFAFADTHNS